VPDTTATEVTYTVKTNGLEAWIEVPADNTSDRWEDGPGYYLIQAGPGKVPSAYGDVWHVNNILKDSDNYITGDFTVDDKKWTHPTASEPANLSDFGYYKEASSTANEAVASLEKLSTETDEEWKQRLANKGIYESVPYAAGAPLGLYRFYKAGTDPDSKDAELTQLLPGTYWLIETGIPEGYAEDVPPVRINIGIDPTDKNKAAVSYAPVTNTKAEKDAYEYYIGKTNLGTRTGTQTYDFRFKNHYLYTMPETGGLGAEHFTAGGIAMMLALLTWWLLRRRFEGIDLPVPAAPAAILSTAKDHKPIYYDRFVNIRTGHLMYKKYRRKEVIQRE
jgi:LPXTG-motif cell wall-anchored protein